MAAISIRRTVGNEGERIACTFLEGKGFEIIERNYLRPWGEIDIIARVKESIRFVEVKTISRENNSNVARENSNMTAEDHIHPAKLKKIVRTAELYMGNRRDDLDCQIDVVTVILDLKTRTARCRLYEQVL